MLHLTGTAAGGFYAVHRERSFYNDLVRYMSSGPVLVLVLEAENAVGRLRDLMGATDPKKAAEGTIRKRFATSIEKNVIHGSDSVENARIEISYFFNALELV
jgi:nucleoside-diphosphate kinase